MFDPKLSEFTLIGSRSEGAQDSAAPELPPQASADSGTGLGMAPVKGSLYSDHGGGGGGSGGDQQAEGPAVNRLEAARLAQFERLAPVAQAVVAVQYGQLEIVERLVNHGAVCAGAVDSEGCPLLHWAAVNNRLDIARFLCDSGADTSATGGIMQENCLQWAVRSGKMEMVRLLVDRGADARARNSHGHDALFLALQHPLDSGGAAPAPQAPSAEDYLDIVIFLLACASADPCSVDKDGFTPLMWVIKNKAMTPDLLRVLLTFGAASEAVLKQTDYEYGNTVLHWGLLAGASPFLLADLMKLGANEHTPNKAGLRPVDFRNAQGRLPGEVQHLLYMRSTFNARRVLPARGFPPAFFLLPALGVLVGSLGWSYGLMAWGLVCYLSSGLVVRAMMQSDNYVQFGAAYSVVCICWLGYWVYLSPVASLLTNFLQAVLCFLMNYYMIQSFRTDPGSPSRPGGDWTDGPTLKPGQAQQLVHSILSNNQKLASSLCVTCMVRKQPRQHHCRSCRKCVERFDHHCPFVANCVGRRNHRYFVGFLFWTCLSLIMWMVLFYYYMYTFCPARVAVWGGLKWLFAAKRALAFCFLASGSSLLWVSPLLLQQIYLVCVGATTYDLIKGKLGFGRPSFKVMCYTFIAFLRGYHEKAQLNDESADPLLMV